MDRSVGSPRTPSIVGIRGPGSVFSSNPNPRFTLSTANFRTVVFFPLALHKSCKSVWQALVHISKYLIFLQIS